MVESLTHHIYTNKIIIINYHEPSLSSPHDETNEESPLTVQLQLYMDRVKPASATYLQPQ